MAKGKRQTLTKLRSTENKLVKKVDKKKLAEKLDKEIESTRKRVESLKKTLKK
ncbi:MAG: hypothetical protein HXX16_17270 [Bacteroidales bacterium]|nr:hypothetical protein [Bacteroidales bacterium]